MAIANYIKDVLKSMSILYIFAFRYGNNKKYIKWTRGHITVFYLSVWPSF